MRKFLCYLLASMTLLASVSTAACGGGLDNSSFESGSAQVSDSENTGETSVNPEDVTLTLKKKSFSIEDGQTVTLQVEFSYNGEALDMALLEFSSSDNSVATVDSNGVVTGIATGKATITVAYGKRATKATINVATRAYRLEVSKESVMLLKGEEEQVTATAYFALEELTDAVIAWESSDPSVATVENGLIKGVGAGEAEITLSLENAEERVAVTIVEEVSKENVNTFSEDYINIYGRSYISESNLALDHAANGVEVGFIGTSIRLTLASNEESYLRVYVDGSNAGARMLVERGMKEYTLASGLEEGCHIVRVVKCTEESSAVWSVQAFDAEEFFAMPKKSDLRIQFIGDSITAGYGVLGYTGQEYSVQNSDATNAYAYLTAHELRADYSILAYSGICTQAYHWVQHLNMDSLYDYYSASNKTAYKENFDADVVVVNLGTNEASYILTGEGGSYGTRFPKDYEAFLRKVRACNPDAYIICLYGMGDRNTVVHLGIQEAIESFGDEKVVYNPIEIKGNAEGANGHPDYTAHRDWADKLKAYIQTLL